MLKDIICAAGLALLSSVSLASPYDPIISMAWVGESVPGQTTATLQLNLTTVKAVKLLSATSPVAETIEIQSVAMSKGALRAHVVKMLPLPDHRTTPFGTRGLFLMMTGIKQPLKLGDQIPISLTVEFANKQSKTITASAEVKKMDLSYKHYGPNEVYDHR